MQNALRRTYSVNKEKVQRNQYSGFIPSKELQRLNESVTHVDTDILVEFQILEGFTELPEIKGHLSSQLTLQCQRCLEDLDIKIDQAFHFYIASNEQKDEELEGLETIYNENGDMLDLYHLIEDEIILNLPLIPKHETECNEYLVQQAQQPEIQETKKNPFEVLKELKQDFKN